MDFREPNRDEGNALEDYSDFGDEFASLMAQELGECSQRDAAPTKADGLIDAIQRYINSVAGDREKTPDEVGSIKGYERRAAINAALVLSIAKALRKCRRRSINTGPYLVYVAIRSDNDYGRCIDSAQRTAEYLGCSEDVVRDIRDDLISVGALRADKRARADRRPGLPAAVWLPYPPEVFLHSDFAILHAFAPARQNRGRPSRKTETTKETSGAYHPTLTKKRRVLSEETSGAFLENVGSLTPDCKNSIQELNSRTQREGARVREAPSKGLVIVSSSSICSEGARNAPAISGDDQGDGASHLWNAMLASMFPFPPRGEQAAAWREEARSENLIARLTNDQAKYIARKAKEALSTKSTNGKAEFPGVGDVVRQYELHIARVRAQRQRVTRWDAEAARMAAIERDEPAVVDLRRKYPEPQWIDGAYGRKTQAALAENEKAFSAAIVAAGLTIRSPGDRYPGEGMEPRPSEELPEFFWQCNLGTGESSYARMIRLMRLSMEQGGQSTEGQSV